MANAATTGKAAAAQTARGSISSFIERNYRHFNSLALRNAADAYNAHVEKGG